MDVNTFTKITEKLETLKQKRAKAEGTLENIQKEWQETYGTTDEEIIKKKLDEITKTIDTTTETIDTLYDELKSLTNWDLI